MVANACGAPSSVARNQIGRPGMAKADQGRDPCMPCSFGPLHSPRSASRAQLGASLGVTVVDSCIPLVPAACGTTGENDDAGTWRQQFPLGQWVRPVSGDYRLVGKGHRPRGRRGWESPTPPPGPSRLASLSSGDDRNRRLSCASTFPIAFCYSAALLPRCPLSAPFGRSLAGELDPMQHSDGPHAIAPRRPRDTGGTPSMPDDWGNALVRWVVLLELEEVIAQRLKG
jgi:hypothetical protein